MRRGFVRDFMKQYAGRLAGMFLLNGLYVVLTIFTFLMIEPFVKLLFRGTLEGLSTLSAYMVGVLSKVLPLDSAGHSVVALILAAAGLFLLRNLSYYASQWIMGHVRSDFLSSLRNRLYDKMISLPWAISRRRVAAMQ